jgi:hypothetical protein
MGSKRTNCTVSGKTRDFVQLLGVEKVKEFLNGSTDQ